MGNNINTERVNFNDKDVKLFWSSLQEVVVVFKPDENFQGVEIYLKAENNNKVRTVHLHYATVLPAPPEVQKGQVTTCKGQSAVLQATKPLGAIFKWYSQQSGGIPVFTGATFTTPAITSETVFYVEAIQAGCTIAQRTPVVIKTTPAPDAPTVSNTTICSGQSATLTASGNPSATINWYDQSGSGAIIATGPSFSTPPLINSATYYVEAFINECPSEKKPVPVNIKQRATKVWDKNLNHYISNIRFLDSIYIITGYTTESGNTYWSKSHVDTLGTIITTQKVLIKNEWIFNSIIKEVSDDSYIFAGTQYSNNNLLIYKIDASENIVWSVDIPANGHQNGASSIIENNDGSFLVAGYTSNTNGKQFDFWIVKLDNNGNILWSKTYGGAYEEILISAIAHPEGGYVLGGYSYGEMYMDAWLMKINGNGDIQWEKKYSKSYMAGIQSLLLAPDGGYLLYIFDYDIGDNLIIKTDSLGNELWSKRIGGSGFDLATTIIPAYGGGYIAGGTSSSSDGDITDINKGGIDIWIYKFDDDGNIIWNKTLGGSQYEYFNLVFNNNDESYLLGGITVSGPNSGDVSVEPGNWLVKIVESNDNCSVREAKKTMGEEAISTYTTTAFPNPFNSYVNVTIAAQEAGDLHVQLYSIEGTLLREVRQYVNSGEDIVTFKTDNLPAGAYIVKLILNNQVVTEKLIKNN